MRIWDCSRSGSLSTDWGARLRFLAMTASIPALPPLGNRYLAVRSGVAKTKLEKAKSPSLPEAAPTTQNPGCREYSAASARIRIVVRVLSDIVR